MDVAAAKNKIKDKRIQEIMWKIDHRDVLDDEWEGLIQEMQAFLKTNPPIDVQRLFFPLGYIEMATMISDGITRWKNSICIRCGKMQEHERCEIYPGYTKETRGIPAEIWAHAEAQCPYFEPKQEENN
ncbi:MAG: hypothetical protein HFI33_15420 [Lachnospiraceae bacterium]|nr:hypothetical protein [Lachnospiraceae bacterium]